VANVFISYRRIDSAPYAGCLQETFDELKALPVPSDGADKVNRFLDLAQSNLERLKNDPSAIADPDALTDARSLAKDLGVDQCLNTS
jgi:hypothetical protein